jgi:hypoxanthine-guanine phosphoribosyltransferase
VVNDRVSDEQCHEGEGTHRLGHIMNSRSLSNEHGHVLIIEDILDRGSELIDESESASYR